MGLHIKVIGAQDVTQNACSAALNTALAAQIVAAAPQSVQMLGSTSASCVDSATGNTTYTFVAVALVQFEG